MNCLKYSLNVESYEDSAPSWLNKKNLKYTTTNNFTNYNFSNNNINIPNQINPIPIDIKCKIREIPPHLKQISCNLVGNIPTPKYELSSFKFDETLYKYDYYTRPGILDYDIRHYKGGLGIKK